MPDLEYATTEEIVREIQKRYPETLLIIAMPHRNNPNIRAYDYFFNGGVAAALGMCELSRVKIHRLIAECNQPKPEGESDE